MNIVVSPETQKMLERQMQLGGYPSAEEAVRAGLAYLEQQESAGDFEMGEMEGLLAAGDAEIDRGEVVDGEQALKDRQQRRAARQQTREMSQYFLTKRANRDLDAIWDLIEQTNGSVVADRIEGELHEVMKMLSDHPLMGHRRMDVRNENYRFWSVYRFVIAYRVDKKPLHVARVIHGSRDFRRLFR